LDSRIAAGLFARLNNAAELCQSKIQNLKSKIALTSYLRFQNPLHHSHIVLTDFPTQHKHRGIRE
jgi:hypothetical protein